MDIRDKNTYFDNSTAKKYLHEYLDQIGKLKSLVEINDLDSIINILEKTIIDKRILYVAGNGGSESITQHSVTDFTKGIFTRETLKTISLGANSSMITALGNDHSFTEIYSKQIEFYATTNDVLLCISSSGNSKNIVNAINTAKEKKMKTISFTGFDGGLAKELSDFNLHVPFNNYGIVEDIHQAFMHIIAQCLFLKISEKK